eukprot:scaffold83060_cov32-Phaeocystis_antarctica.AAC.1
MQREVEGVHRLGSFGYQTGPSEPQVTTRGRATCTKWLMSTHHAECHDCESHTHARVIFSHIGPLKLVALLSASHQYFMARSRAAQLRPASAACLRSLARAAPRRGWLKIDSPAAAARWHL